MTKPEAPRDPLSLHLELESPLLQRAWGRARPWVERATGLAELATVYRNARSASTPREFAERVLAELDIGCDVTELDRARIPKKGAAVMVANHPYGAAEGLVLASLALSIRPDVKLLANHLLGRIPELRDALILVDPFGGAEAALSNLRGLREAHRWLAKGGMLVVFPAGEVASFHRAERRIVEAPWNPMIARLARQARAAVVPVHFAGTNGPLFHAAGLVHPRLRTGLLPRTFLDLRGAKLDARVGAPISPRRLEELGSDEERIEYLRQRTEMLGVRTRPTKPTPFARFSALLQRKRGPARIVDPEPRDALEREMAMLPADRTMVEDGDVVVICARAHEIPRTLREIGRLREVTFREVGEGTNQEIDLDAFDASYFHLFAWHRKERELVGAYRLGPTDEIIPRSGVPGLYTSTLFELRPELFRRIGPALEMGRSFVAPRWQRSAAGLFALWRGIGQVVARSPRYRVLYGPVSVSDAYQYASRELILHHLEEQHMHRLRGLVRPRTPFVRRRHARVAGTELATDIDEVSGLVADIEPDHKGVPVLLRQYLRLGGKMLGFNVDPAFSQVLDGLVMVDLVETDRKVLDRYFGAAQAARFLEFHGAGESASG